MPDQNRPPKDYKPKGEVRTSNALDVGTVQRPDIATSAIRNDQYFLTKDEFLKFVELDLWEKIKSRLWRVVGVFLTAVSIAGFLGVRYYVDDLVAESQKDFALRRAEILQRGRLHSSLSTTYQSQKMQLLRDIHFLSASIEELKIINRKSADALIKLDNLETNLHTLASTEDFSSVGSSSLNDLRATEELAKIKVAPPRIMRNEVSSTRATITNYEQHPICDGTLKGALDNIRYSIVSLAAFDLAMR